jgi:hypothetical protein
VEKNVGALNYHTNLRNNTDVFMLFLVIILCQLRKRLSISVLSAAKFPSKLVTLPQSMGLGFLYVIERTRNKETGWIDLNTFHYLFQPDDEQFDDLCV